MEIALKALIVGGYQCTFKSFFYLFFYLFFFSFSALNSLSLSSLLYCNISGYISDILKSPGEAPCVFGYSYFVIYHAAFLC